MCGVKFLKVLKIIFSVFVILFWVSTQNVTRIFDEN